MIIIVYVDIMIYSFALYIIYKKDPESNAVPSMMMFMVNWIFFIGPMIISSVQFLWLHIYMVVKSTCSM